jgi:D-glycero-D-manno-heptose 1,7-bisphosphate phosphatase
VVEKKNRAVFIDRDGVLVKTNIVDGKSYAVRSLSNFNIFPEAATALALLKTSGYLVIVITNQPDVSNKLIKKSVIEEMHTKLTSELLIDAIFTCYHGQNEGCPCRKPQPGLLLEAAATHHIDFSKSFMIGDRKSDIVAGQSVGCYSIFIDRDYSEPKPKNPDGIAKNVREATNLINKYVKCHA